jgi:hypothetical protein
VAADRIAQGARLERRIGAYFARHGYAVTLNERVVGRSGAIHEIDVLAARDDGVTQVTIAVECKALSYPIEKDVVSKLSLVVADAGIHKGIVAAAHGWRSGAEQVAAELGIELWGPDTLRDRLRDVPDGDGPPQPRLVAVLPGTVRPVDELRRSVRQHTQSLLGTGREEILWEGPAHLPAHLCRAHYGVRVREFLRPATIRMTPFDALYSALDNRLLRVLEDPPPPPESQTTADAVAPKTSARPLTTALATAVGRAHEVTTASARERWAEKLRAVGLPQVPHSLSVESVTLVHQPVWAALLRRRGQRRWLAVDAVSGRLDEAQGQAMTAELEYVATALRVPPL